MWANPMFARSTAPGPNSSERSIPRQGFGRLVLMKQYTSHGFVGLSRCGAAGDAAFAVLQCEVVLSPGVPDNGEIHVDIRIVRIVGQALWSAIRRRPNTAPATCTRRQCERGPLYSADYFQPDPAEGPNPDRWRAELRAAPPACSLPKTPYKCCERSPREKRGLMD